VVLPRRTQPYRVVDRDGPLLDNFERQSGKTLADRFVELPRMVAHFDYADLLLTIGVAESLMRERRMDAAYSPRSGRVN